MGSLVDFARKELELLGEDEMQEEMNKDVLQVLELLESQGHSGLSISLLMYTLNRLVKFLPLTSLTGEDDEWEPLDFDSDTSIEQNKRCPRVFRNAGDNSTAHDVEAKIFEDENGIRFSCRESSLPITFPYCVPTDPEVILYLGEGRDGDND